MENRIPCNLKVKALFKTFDYRGDSYRKKCILKYIRDDINDGINTDKFEIKEDDELYCNAYGAGVVARWLNINFDIYENELSFLNACNMLTEDKILLNTDIYLSHNEEDFEPFDEIHPETINNYISYKCAGMCLLGKRLEEIDQNLLSNKDRNTINNTVYTYNDEAKVGNEQAERILAAYDYVDKNDPGICIRSLYNFQHEYIDIDEEDDKLSRLNVENMTKCFKESNRRLEKIRKKHEKKSKKK